MVPDGQTDGRNGRTDGRTHGRRQNYIPPTSSGDNKNLNLLLAKEPTFSNVMQHCIHTVFHYLDIESHNILSINLDLPSDYYKAKNFFCVFT